MKSKVVIFTIADRDNMKYAEGLKNSFKKFHPDIDFVIFNEGDIKASNDPMLYYRATPYFGLHLLTEGYGAVVKLDADQVVTGDISHVWEGDFDVATVHNSNPKEMKKLVVQLQGIGPMEYQNCGFVVMKNAEFVKFWLALCLNQNRFLAFQYREQDILNNIIYWGKWKVKFLDAEGQWHGLISRGYEPGMILKDDRLILPAHSEGWPKEDVQIVCWHQAGGNLPIKMNFHTLFKPIVAKWLIQLTK